MGVGRRARAGGERWARVVGLWRCRIVGGGVVGWEGGDGGSGLWLVVAWWLFGGRGLMVMVMLVEGNGWRAT